MAYPWLRSGEGSLTKHVSGIDAAPRGAAWKYSFFGRTAIYAMGPKAERPIKIGIASDIYTRFLNLQGAHWDPLWVHYLVWCQGPLVATRIEKEAHTILAKNKIRGEWFDITPQLACDTIHVAAERLSLKLFTHRSMIERLEDAMAREILETDDLLGPLFWSRKLPGGA